MKLMQPLSVLSQGISGSIFPSCSIPLALLSWPFKQLYHLLPIPKSCGTVSHPLKTCAANTDDTSVDGRLSIVFGMEMDVCAEGG